jgi:hypothetical protein
MVFLLAPVIREIARIKTPYKTPPVPQSGRRLRAGHVPCKTSVCPRLQPVNVTIESFSGVRRLRSFRQRYYDRCRNAHGDAT